MTQLSKHFTLEEFTFSQTAVRKNIDNTPTPEALDNLFRTANLMEQVRELLGKPIHISSGYRGPQLNKAIGGSKTSAHMQGLACDFVCHGFGTPLAITKEIASSVIGFDQLIYEGTWVHIGLAENPRREILTAKFYGGKTTYLHGIVE